MDENFFKSTHSFYPNIQTKPASTYLASITYANGAYTMAVGTLAGVGDITIINGATLNKKVVIPQTVTKGLAGGAGVIVIGTDYNDSFLLNDGDTVVSGTGKDTINASGADDNAVITVGTNGYTYGSDVLVIADALAAAAGAADAVKLIGNDGSVSVKAAAADSAKVQLAATNGYYKATLSKGDGSASYNVWHGGASAASMDGSSETAPLIMASGAGSDTLIGGSKADNIYATTAGAYAIGGAGSDHVEFVNGDGAREFVAIGNSSGKDTVVHFETGFDAANDVLVLQEGAVSDLSIKDMDANGTVLKVGDSSVSLVGVADGANHVSELSVQDTTGNVSKLDIVTDEQVGTVLADHQADYYAAKSKGGLDFSAIGEDLVVDLGNSGNFEDDATFSNIVSVIGGTGNTTLVGASDKANTLQGSAANTTLWGGGSNDILIGAGVGGDAFFVSAYDGKDTVRAFQTGVDAETADTLYMLGSGASSVKNDGNNTSLTFADGSSVLLEGVSAGNGSSAANAIRFSTDGKNVQAAVIGLSNNDTSFVYSSDVDMYFGGSKSDTLSVDNTFDGNSIDIRLNNTGAQGFSSVEAVNAAAFTEKAFLSGSDENSELITGGQGKTTIWGGLGAVSDTLRGTPGDVTEFYFGKNNGSDVITASDSDDKVVFYDFANTDLTAIDTSGNQLKFTFNDGSNLQVTNHTSASVQEFQFTNSSWTYDKSTRAFTQVK